MGGLLQLGHTGFLVALAAVKTIAGHVVSLAADVDTLSSHTGLESPPKSKGKRVATDDSRVGDSDAATLQDTMHDAMHDTTHEARPGQVPISTMERCLTPFLPFGTLIRAVVTGATRVDGGDGGGPPPANGKGKGHVGCEVGVGG